MEGGRDGGKGGREGWREGREGGMEGRERGQQRRGGSGSNIVCLLTFLRYITNGWEVMKEIGAMKEVQMEELQNAMDLVGFEEEVGVPPMVTAGEG